MKPESWKWVAFAAVFVLGVWAAFVGGRQCGSGVPTQPVDTGVNTSTQDAVIIKRVEALEKQAEARIVEIERQHQEAIEQFDSAQAAEYQQVRQNGPEAVARWLTEFNQELCTDGTTR